MDSSPEKIKSGEQVKADDKWSTLENIDMRQEKNVEEVIKHFSNNPDEVGLLSQELVAARDEADKEGATWDQDKHTYVDKNGLPMDWAHLTGHLKNNPEAVKTAVETYQKIKEVDYYSKNPDQLAQELVAARKDDAKDNATWDADKRTYRDENGLPLDWAHLTGYLKNNPAAVKTAIETLQGLKSDNQDGNNDKAKKDNPDNKTNQGNPDDKPESAIRKDYNMRLKWGRYARHIIELNPRGADEKLEDYNNRIRKLIPTINEFRSNDKFANGPDYPDVGPNSPQESRVHSFAAPRSDVEPRTTAADKPKDPIQPATTAEKNEDDEKKLHAELLRFARSAAAVDYLDELGVDISKLKDASNQELADIKKRIEAKIAEKGQGKSDNPDNKAKQDNPENKADDKEKISSDEMRKRLRSFEYISHLDEAGIDISTISSMSDEELTAAYDKVEAIRNGNKDESAAAEKDKSFDIFNLHKKIGAKITSLADLVYKAVTEPAVEDTPEPAVDNAPKTGADQEIPLSDQLAIVKKAIKDRQDKYENASKLNFLLRNKLIREITTLKGTENTLKAKIEQQQQNQQPAAA